MLFRPLLAGFGNRLWQVFNRNEHRLFLSESGRLEEVQRRLLRAALRDMSHTAWGERHGLLSAWSYEQFCAEVPLQSYDSLQPFLVQENGLVPEPVVCWEPTGGSAGGSKWIPWTRGLQSQFKAAVAPWVNEMYLEFPPLRNGRSFWQLTPRTRLEAPSWLFDKNSGFAHDGDYLGRLGRLLERLVLLSVSRDEDGFWEKAVDLLSKARDLTYISCWSPSYLLVLKSRFEEHLGYWDPSRTWPSLRVISCWTQGPSAALIPRVRSAFPDLEIVGKGLLSTEAVTTIPFLGLYPLAYRSHFFEFLADDGTVSPSWDLRGGGEYEVVQTTAGGLIRYRSGDRVRVTGFFRSVPCLRFVGRIGVEDRFGEKLSHLYLQSLLERLPGFSALGYESGGYVLFLESEQAETSVGEYLNAIERALNEVYTYRDCRELRQLKPLRAFLIEGDAWDRWRKLVAENNAAVKFSSVLPEGVWSERFNGRFHSETG